jgi:hypothetical protein
MTELREIRKERQIQSKKHSHPKIISCQVSREKITVELEDKREISLPFDLIVKE